MDESSLVFHVWDWMMRRASKTLIGGLAIAIGVATLTPTTFAAPKPKPAPPVLPTAGYDATVAGVYTGTGTATSGGTAVSITATVTDENGQKGDLSVKDLQVDDKLHFSGKGTAFGKTIKVVGRLDPVPANDPQLKTQRLVATFITTDDSHGRIIAYVPIKPGATGGGGGAGGGGGSGGGGSGGGSGGGTPPPKPPKPPTDD